MKRQREKKSKRKREEKRKRKKKRRRKRSRNGKRKQKKKKQRRKQRPRQQSATPARAAARQRWRTPCWIRGHLSRICCTRTPSRALCFVVILSPQGNFGSISMTPFGRRTSQCSPSWLPMGSVHLALFCHVPHCTCRFLTSRATSKASTMW